VFVLFNLGKLTEGEGRLSTVELLGEVACFVKRSIEKAAHMN